MGRSRVSGPWAGAYNTLQFATPVVQGTEAATGAANRVFWSWTVPAGMDIVVVDAQVYAVAVGTNPRVNILAGGASILQNVAGSTAAGLGLTANIAAANMGGTQATPSDGVFGTASTSIIAPTTPSLASDIVKPIVGAYIVSGATLAATIFQSAGTTTALRGTILFYPVSHPSRLKSAFE